MGNLEPTGSELARDFACDGCGACCRYPIVEVYAIDVLREPRLLEADRSVPLEGLLDDDKCLILAGAKPCYFLGSDNRCGIYPTRPNVCVAFMAGDDDCQMARVASGLPPLLPHEVIR